MYPRLQAQLRRLPGSVGHQPVAAPPGGHSLHTLAAGASRCPPQRRYRRPAVRHSARQPGPPPGVPLQGRSQRQAGWPSFTVSTRSVQGRATAGTGAVASSTLPLHQLYVARIEAVAYTLWANLMGGKGSQELACLRHHCGRIGHCLGQRGACVAAAGLGGAGLHRLPQGRKVGGGAGEAGGVCGQGRA